ncbi:MAG TPA: hypothetical protein VEQ63_15235, partial [Bryobacteraceae bacterium]|nr:hypothetical protein [Bryobacteraceae bacterium]
SQRTTVAFDLTDQIVIDAPKSKLTAGTTASGLPYSAVSYPNVTRHELSASAGFKSLLFRDPNPAAGRSLVLTANMLMRINKAGLRARVVPLIALSYIF